MEKSQGLSAKEIAASYEKSQDILNDGILRKEIVAMIYLEKNFLQRLRNNKSEKERILAFVERVLELENFAKSEGEFIGLQSYESYGQIANVMRAIYELYTYFTFGEWPKMENNLSDTAETPTLASSEEIAATSNAAELTTQTAVFGSSARMSIAGIDYSGSSSEKMGEDVSDGMSELPYAVDKEALQAEGEDSQLVVARIGSEIGEKEEAMNLQGKLDSGELITSELYDLDVEEGEGDELLQRLASEPPLSQIFEEDEEDIVPENSDDTARSVAKNRFDADKIMRKNSASPSEGVENLEEEMKEGAAFWEDLLKELDEDNMAANLAYANESEKSDYLSKTFKFVGDSPKKESFGPTVQNTEFKLAEDISVNSALILEIGSYLENLKRPGYVDIPNALNKLKELQLEAKNNLELAMAELNLAIRDWEKWSQALLTREQDEADVLLESVNKKLAIIKLENLRQIAAEANTIVLTWQAFFEVMEVKFGEEFATLATRNAKFFSSLKYLLSIVEGILSPKNEDVFFEITESDEIYERSGKTDFEYLSDNFSKTLADLFADTPKLLADFRELWTQDETYKKFTNDKEVKILKKAIVKATKSFEKSSKKDGAFVKHLEDALGILVKTSFKKAGEEIGKNVGKYLWLKIAALIATLSGGSVYTYNNNPDFKNLVDDSVKGVRSVLKPSEQKSQTRKVVVRTVYKDRVVYKDGGNADANKLENPEEILDLIRMDLAEKLEVLSEQITDRFLIEIYEKIKGDTDNSILEVVNPGLSQALNFKDLLKKETKQSIRAKMSKFFRK